MQLNDTSTKQGLYQDACYELFGDSDDHTSEYPLADFVRHINRWYDMVVTKILQSDSRWEWDDTNKTDLPIANISLVSGQQDYGITSATFLKVSRVDCKDANGNSLNLIQFNHNQLRGIGLNSFENTPGTPKHYRKQASSVFLYPAPNYNYTNGLRIFYQRNVDYFVAADTTKVPGFAEPFHRILSLGAAYEYARVNGLMTKATMLMNQIGTKVITRVGTEKMTGMLGDLEEFYSSRNADKISMSVNKEDYGQISLGSSPSQGRYGQRQNGFF